jgi:hypothetical protein
MAAADSGNRGGCGCLAVFLGTIAFAAIAEVIVQGAATSHPGFFVNRPGWAEASAFVFGFLSVVLGLIWIALFTRFYDRDKTIAWVLSLLIAPALIVCAGFALQALPPRFSGDCNYDSEAQTCAYIHAHPFAVLALFVGVMAGAAVCICALVYRYKRKNSQASGSVDGQAPQIADLASRSAVSDPSHRHP